MTFSDCYASEVWMKFSCRICRFAFLFRLLWKSVWCLISCIIGSIGRIGSIGSIGSTLYCVRSKKCSKLTGYFVVRLQLAIDKQISQTIYLSRRNDHFGVLWLPPPCNCWLRNLIWVMMIKSQYQVEWVEEGVEAVSQFYLQVLLQRCLQSFMMKKASEKDDSDRRRNSIITICIIMH